MQDTNERQHLKRTTDHTSSKYSDNIPCCPVCGNASVVTELVKEVGDINRKISLMDTAFLRDDLSSPDYPGHRSFHLERRAVDKIISEYKISGTKVIIGIVITFMLGLIASGFVAKLANILATGG